MDKAQRTEALAALLTRAVAEGTARVVYLRQPGTLETWWLQVDRTRISADEHALLVVLTEEAQATFSWCGSRVRHPSHMFEYQRRQTGCGGVGPDDVFGGDDG